MPFPPDRKRNKVQLVRFTEAEYARALVNLARWRKETGKPLASLAAFIRSLLK